MGDDRNRRFVSPLIDALASLGVGHAVVTPGSRNSPLSFSLYGHQGIADHSMLDERSAAFMALGIATATRSPVILSCTSGTAAAEYVPAIVEADLSRVPLIVITADRPAALTGVGAPQASAQSGMYGSAVRWSHDMEVPPPGDLPDGYPEALAAHLWTEAMSVPPGPVHLNLRLREPLVPEGEPPLPGVTPSVEIGLVEPTGHAVRRVAEAIAGRSALLLAGPQTDPALPSAAAALAAAFDVPIVADPLSGLRAGRHDLSRVVASGDLLASARWIDSNPPDVVLRFGAIPTSKALWSWLAAHRETPQIVVDPAGWRDPTATASLMIRSEAAPTLAAVAEHGGESSPAGWVDSWMTADSVARQALGALLDTTGFPSEPDVARIVCEALPDRATLWTSSSMPVRDIDLCLPPTPRPIFLRANRGANGIDGFLSTGFGHALVAPGPTVMLAGDLTVIHDLTSIAAAVRLGIDATVVVVDNDGGGIFHLLPQADEDPGVFEKHFGTPQGIDLVAVATAMGAHASTAMDRSELIAAITEPGPGVRFVTVRTDRSSNAALHREIRSVARRSLA
ncbi:2-succinyl-5-enolpyruvyl-6-hydroxy-3-cyclohexene-1-carboxylic-acid synthase [bacterium]|nr:2-succinyl-5-enolpyruvyl-6-hydroxy-3-cyclohexene-1-carboxylic-acid synthase [bacterium]